MTRYVHHVSLEGCIDNAAYSGSRDPDGVRQYLASLQNAFSLGNLRKKPATYILSQHKEGWTIDPLLDSRSVKRGKILIPAHHSRISEGIQQGDTALLSRFMDNTRFDLTEIPEGAYALAHITGIRKIEHTGKTPKSPHTQPTRKAYYAITFKEKEELPFILSPEVLVPLFTYPISVLKTQVHRVTPEALDILFTIEELLTQDAGMERAEALMDSRIKELRSHMRQPYHFDFCSLGKNP
jgi:hypothetical protein